MTSRKDAPLWLIAALSSGTSCALSPEKLRATKLAPSCIAIAVMSMAESVFMSPRLLFEPLSVVAVVLDQIDHVDAAADAVCELAQADRSAVAVAGDAEIDEVAVGEVGAGEHRRHAAMHAVEAVRRTEEICRRLRRAADAREFGDAMRRQIELETGLDDGGADRIMTAAGAQRRDRALVIAMGEAELVGRQLRMVELGLGDIGHGAVFLSGVTLSARIFSPMPRMMKRAVIGVPS